MKLNLSKCEGFSTHRSGWSYALKSLMPFHSNNGIFLDDFIERKFIWSTDESHYNFPWIGILHLPYQDINEFGARNSISFLFNKPNFIKSLEKCLCLITLSEDLRNQANHYLNNKIPIISVKYPAEKPPKLWNKNKFLKNPSVTKLGYWLRDFIKFYNDANILKENNVNLDIYCMPGNINEYRRIWTNIMYEKGNFYYHNPINLNNKDFDEHMAKTVVWCWFHYTAANTAIIESMIRNAPIFTNRLPSTIEYLGENYPLYGTENLIDENGVIRIDKVLEAHEYLKNMDKEFLSGEYFAYDLITKLKKNL